MNDYNLITVALNDDNKMTIENPTEYKLIGKGGQGAVFKIDQDRCIKIYLSEEIAEKERAAYERTIGSSIMPKFYDFGRKYIIIEYIDGPDLKEYLLQKEKVSYQITQELIHMFYEMRRLNFLRRDESLRHILIKEDKQIKVVDHCYAFSLNDPMPVKMFKQLRDLGMLEEFIEKGFHLAPLLFKEFKEKMPQFFI